MKENVVQFASYRLNPIATDADIRAVELATREAIVFFGEKEFAHFLVEHAEPIQAAA